MGWADLYPWRAPAPGEPVVRQLYEQVRDAIHAGALRPGGKLPSTRDFARALGVARASAVAAYELLLAEGYVAGRSGAGTFVCEDLSGVLELRAPAAPARPTPPPAAPPRLAAVSALDDLPQTFEAPRPLSNGCTMMDARALAAWSAATRRALKTLEPVHFGYSEPAGDAGLRRAICDYLRAARGVVAEPDEVIVTAGAQHAIDLVVRLLLEPGASAWVEDPGYAPTWHALAAAGARLAPVPVDAAGLMVAEGVAAAPDARLAVVTPSHQYPLGVTLSLARRLELIAWAQASGAFIVEDDYASEFRYSGPPLASLQGLDGGERTLYVGTLNKALFPGLRMGYLVAPRALAPAFRAARQLIDRQPPTLTQAVVRDFMESGQFAAHIRRRRLAYRAQRDALAEALDARLGAVLEVDVPDQGMHLIAYLKDGRSDLAVEAAAARAGLVARGISRLYRAAPPRQGLILGFSGFPAGVLRAGVARLARVLAP